MDNIATQLTQLQTIKQNIATAIEGKGGTVGTGFASYATAISNLPSGGGTAQIRMSENVGLKFGNSTFSSLPEWLILDDLPAGCFSNCSNLTSIAIPSSVTSVGNDTFNGCTSLATITGGSNVTSIGNNSFKSAAVSSIPFSGSLTSIGNNAFEGCYSLKNITIPGSVTNIGNYAFAGCQNLTSLTFDNCQTSIGGYAFQRCGNLTSVDFGNSVTSIGTYAFYNDTKLTSVTIPSSVTLIGTWAFYYCNSLTSITLPAVPNLFGNNLTSNYGQFRQVPVVTIDIPGAIGIIPRDVFCMCKQCTSLTIGEGITQIGQGAFYNMEGLTELTIPSTVTYISSDAFFACINLTKLIVLATTPPTLANDVLQASLTYPIYVPTDSYNDYISSNWGTYYSSRIHPMSDLPS